MPEMRYSPMLLTEIYSLPRSSDIIGEVKLDGHRAPCEISSEQPIILTRNGHDRTRKYSAIADALPSALSGHEAVVDGEIVGYDAAGRHSFGELRKGHPRAVLFIFDLLEIDDEPIIDAPLAERRQILEEIYIAPQDKRIQLVTQFDDCEALLNAAKKTGQEGIVIKKSSSPYEPGIRSEHWLKLILRRHTEGFARY